MQQRQARDRADVDARAGDVGDRGGDDQVRAGALEVPGQLPQLGARHRGRARHGDGVDAQGRQLRHHPASRPDVGQLPAVVGDVHVEVVRQRGRHDVEPGVRLALDLLGERQHLLGAAHHHHPVQAHPSLA